MGAGQLMNTHSPHSAARTAPRGVVRAGIDLFFARLTSRVGARGVTAFLPVWFAGVLIASSVVEVITAIVSMSVNPDDAGAALRIASVVIRPGVGLVGLVIGLGVAVLIGWSSDERALSSSDRLELRRTPAATIAGWVSTLGGVGMLAFFSYVIWLLWQEALAFPVGERPSDGVIALMAAAAFLVAAIVSLLPTVLGVLVLRHRTWARYAAIVYFALAFVGVQTLPVLEIVPLLGTVSLVVPVLLVWAELRERGFTGSFRDCWRGLPLFVLNLGALATYMWIAVGTDDPDAQGGFAVLSIGMTVYYVFALLLAMWAANKDENELWSGLNAALVVWSQLLIAFVGLVATVVKDVLPTIG